MKTIPQTKTKKPQETGHAFSGFWGQLPACEVLIKGRVYSSIKKHRQNNEIPSMH
ncbi:MAG: hypothetical protein NZ748_03070 [Candidatus Marinimicrobia bacterium]|nr:hypothetical protein [Candidatus Neomarinimicrobiota bacterium]